MINSPVVIENTENFRGANEGIRRAGWRQDIIKVLPSAFPFSVALAAAGECVIGIVKK